MAACTCNPVTKRVCDECEILALQHQLRESRAQLQEAQEQTRETEEQLACSQRDSSTWYRRATDAQTERDEAIERAERAKALVAKLREAGVTDYSKPPWGLNRVDCHFCPSVWRADGPPKHKANCPLLTAEALRGGDDD